MGYGVTIKLNEEQLKQIKEDNRFNSYLEYDFDCGYYDVLINSFHIQQKIINDNNTLLSSNLYYNLLRVKLNNIKNILIAECNKNFIKEHESDGEVNYYGWDKKDFTEDDMDFEKLMKYTIRDLIIITFCRTFEDEFEKIREIEETLDCFIDNVKNAQIYTLISKYQNNINNEEE